MARLSLIRCASRCACDLDYPLPSIEIGIAPTTPEDRRASRRRELEVGRREEARVEESGETRRDEGLSGAILASSIGFGDLSLLSFLCLSCLFSCLESQCSAWEQALLHPKSKHKMRSGASQAVFPESHTHTAPAHTCAPCHQTFVMTGDAGSGVIREAEEER